MHLIARSLTILVLGAALFSVPSSSTARVPSEPEQRGCCSHHKGVCGCEKGRVKCCDGTMSPSCRC